MTRLYIYLALIALLSGGLIYIQYRLNEARRLEAENTIIKQENKEIRHEAQSFADRPRNRADRINKLCKWAAHTAREGEGKPIKQLPAFCSACPL